MMLSKVLRVKRGFLGHKVPPNDKSDLNWPKNMQIPPKTFTFILSGVLTADTSLVNPFILIE